MKLQTYNPQVAPNTIGNARVQSFGDGGAAQAAANIGRMQGQSLVGLAGAIQGAAENMDAVNVQAASNEYTKRLNELLYNQDNGLMNTQMQGAEGITKTFEEKERQIRQEVGSQFTFLSAKGAFTFNRLTDNSAAQRYELVRKHQTQQYNAWRDVTFDNAIGLNVQTAADNYTTPEVVAQNMAEAIATTRMRYAGQGEEVIKAQERKALGNITQQVISRAYANGDYLSAEKYLNQYGKTLTPEQYTAFKKNVSNIIQAEKTTADLTLLAQQYTDLPTYLQKVGELYDSTHFDGVEAYNMPTQVANIDEQVKQLTPEFRAALPAIGGILKHKFGLDAVISSGARTREHQMEINPSAPNSHHIIRENGGDAVDIVLPDSTTQEQYDKIKAYFENSGAFAEVLNHDVGSGYHLHLGGYRGGLDKKSSPLDRKKYMENALAEFNNQKRIKNMMRTEIEDNVESQLFEMYKTGNLDPAAVNALVLQSAGNDPKLFMKLTQTAGHYFSVSKKASGAGLTSKNGNTALDPMLEPMLVDMMTTQGYTNTQMIEWINRNKDNPEYAGILNQRGCAKALELMQQRVEGKGAFAYNWKAVEDLIMENYKGKNKDYAWAGIKTGLIYQIDNYWVTNHRAPTPNEVVQMGNAYITKHSYDAPGLFNTKNEVWKYDLANMGIYYINETPDGTNDVVIKSGNEWVRRRLSDAELRRVVEEGEPVQNYTGEANYNFTGITR